MARFLVYTALVFTVSVWAVVGAHAPAWTAAVFATGFVSGVAVLAVARSS